ncbi:hypothetical protein M2281_004438 [Mesorhizobium soli]|nr:hypothetical protein [Mesorhizobium soli]
MNLTQYLSGTRRRRDDVLRARAAFSFDMLSAGARALRLVLPLLLLLFVSLGQAALAHSDGTQLHHSHAAKVMSHHTKSDTTCCGDRSQNGAAKSCLVQCLASCSYCAPLPLAAALPEIAVTSPAPSTDNPLRGAIASPYPRPPSIS